MGYADIVEYLGNLPAVDVNAVSLAVEWIK